MPADPEYVKRQLGKLDAEIKATREILAYEEKGVQETRKRLDTLEGQKRQFERDVASVDGCG